MKRKKSPEGGSNWMDTYGDMVTLLLCFFVLLYSMSSVDQAKWEILVKSFNPDAEKEISQVVMDQTIEPGDDDVKGSTKKPDDADAQFDRLYEALKQRVKDLGMESDVSLTKGDGFTFISFQDKVFFDGDSSVLRDDGKQVLDQFTQVLVPAAAAIKEIQVLGHTSQAKPDEPNDVLSDRVLSAERSAQVVAYVQLKGIIDPYKLVSSAYGQFRPIDTFSTREGRARNQRVEMLITKEGSVEKSLEQYYNTVYGDTVKNK